MKFKQFIANLYIAFRFAKILTKKRKYKDDKLIGQKLKRKPRL